MKGTGVVCVKLALAAVEATDWAMEGTVNWAKRDEGRPARAGTPDGSMATGAAGAATAASLVGKAALAKVPDFTVCVLGFEATASAGLTLAVVFTESFDLTFSVGLTTLSAFGLATSVFATALAAALTLTATETSGVTDFSFPD